ncbi:histidine kinase [Streptomyces sp. NBC_00414]|uniref:sensor histidine kinase n=1 Tax=Streptomyces sp. NBC_00414 TaxID=2975739 RepID=UPI002E208462
MISLRRAPQWWRQAPERWRRAPKWWRRADVTTRDLPLGLLCLALSFLPDFHGTQIGGLPNRPFDGLALVAVALESLPLAVRRRWPVVCLALVSAGFAVDQLRGYHAFAGTALPIALLSAGAHLRRYRRTAAVVFSVAYVPLAVAFSRVVQGEPGEPPSELVTFYLALVLAWGLGAWLHSTRVANAEHRLRIAEDTRATERARIARELHDVVTHHVTAMVVQAEAARYLTASPERLDQSLTAVTDTGRRAITDLRHLLDLLNPDHGTGTGTGAGQGAGHAPGARTPPVGRLLTLVERTRQAGQPVEFTEEGTPAESTGSAELVAYRVVQEALTNALKYAHGSRTSVRVRYTEREITVEVGTDGAGSGAGSPGGSGRGLAGLRERVDVLGGDFSAGPRPAGGFVVRARIPAGSPS